MSEKDRNGESLAAKKRKMLHDAHHSIAQLLKEINQHRFPHYPLEERIVQKKTEIKFAATREKSRRRGTSIVARGEPAIQQGKRVNTCAKKRDSPSRGMGARKESNAIRPDTVTRDRTCKKKAVGPNTPGTPNKNNKAPTPVSLEKLIPNGKSWQRPLVPVQSATKASSNLLTKLIWSQRVMLKEAVRPTHAALLLFCRHMAVQIQKIQETRAR
jgi:hypothetical protein